MKSNLQNVKIQKHVKRQLIWIHSGGSFELIRLKFLTKIKVDIIEYTLYEKYK